MERTMALQQINDWQEKHVFVYLVDFVQYLPWTNFVRGVFEDCPVWDKICKIAANCQVITSKIACEQLSVDRL